MAEDTNADKVFKKLLETNTDLFNDGTPSNKPKSKNTTSSKKNESMNRKSVKKTRTDYEDPERLDDPDEQIQVIAEVLCRKIADGNIMSAVMYVREWIDGAVDGNGNIYAPLEEELSTLDKADLIKFIGGILGSVR